MYNFNLSIILPINDDFELSVYEMYVKFISHALKQVKSHMLQNLMEDIIL
jgi:hypothetical protein